MNKKEIFDQIQALQGNQSQNTEYVVIPIDGTMHKIGVSPEGYPKFFVRTSDSSSSARNTTLEILSVEYGIPCTFVDDDNKSQSLFYTVITLRSLDQTLYSIFFDIFLLMLNRLPEVPTKHEIAIEIENIISIFSAMTCPPRKEIQGLWAELLVIEQSINPENVICAWHSSPVAKYDFTLGRDKIEVKSTSGEIRKHHFSLDQLNPSKNSRLIIASIIVRESGHGNGGISIKELYDKICQHSISVDSRIRLYQIIAVTMGTEIHKMNDVFFDYVEAVDTLRFYDSKDIPGVDKEAVRQGVSGVGFNSDLTDAPDVKDANSSFSVTDSPLFNSVFQF